MKESRQKLNVITCPKCGREYLPAEIFLPKSFIGNPSDIVKTFDGKIDIFDGRTMDVNEEYCCDGCKTSFKVTANVNFKAYIDEKKEFPSEYVSPLYVDKISLFEG